MKKYLHSFLLSFSLMIVFSSVFNQALAGDSLSCQIVISDGTFHWNRPYRAVDPNPSSRPSDHAPDISRAKADAIDACIKGEQKLGSADAASRCDPDKPSEGTSFQCSSAGHQIQFSCYAVPLGYEGVKIYGAGSTEQSASGIAVDNCLKNSEFRSCDPAPESCLEKTDEPVKSWWKIRASNSATPIQTNASLKTLPSEPTEAPTGNDRASVSANNSVGI